MNEHINQMSQQMSQVSLDQASAVRASEEIAGEPLGAFLREQLGGGGDVEIEQFPKGHSNLTYLVRYGGREYVLRRPPHGSEVKSAHDMGREHRILSKLAPVFAKAPKPVLYCEDSTVIGAPFYLMERIRGVILRRSLPTGLTIDSATATRLSEVLIDTLAELHSLDYTAAGLGSLGKPVGYVERQITGWSQRYGAAKTDDIAAMDELATWLHDNMPADGAPALIHNDFKFDNIILDSDNLSQVIGILDWEMSTIGDPLMDLGTSLCYWVQRDDPPLFQEMRFGPTTAPGMLSRAELAERYARASGRELSNIHYYYVYGLFKIAVVAQQIYYRYARGLTRDQRFAKMILGVRALSEQGRAVLARGGM